jgi:hypothetical protein
MQNVVPSHLLDSEHYDFKSLESDRTEERITFGEDKRHLPDPIAEQVVSWYEAK